MSRTTNVVLLSGYAQDASQKYGSGSGRSFILGVKRAKKVTNGFEEVTDCHPVYVGGYVADYCQKFLKKGAFVTVTGSLMIDPRDNKTWIKGIDVLIFKDQKVPAGE